MQVNRKALLASLLVSMPAPLVLGGILRAFDTLFVFQSTTPLTDYFATYVVTVVVALVTVSLSHSRPAAAASKIKRKLQGSEEGTVKWFNVKKGFGFITRDSGDDVFVHFRAIEGHGRKVLRQGQRVSFTVVDAEKGLQANDVTVTDGSDE